MSGALPLFEENGWKYRARTGLCMFCPQLVRPLPLCFGGDGWYAHACVGRNCLSDTANYRTFAQDRGDRAVRSILLVCPVAGGRGCVCRDIAGVVTEDHAANTGGRTVTIERGRVQCNLLSRTPSSSGAGANISIYKLYADFKTALKVGMDK